MKTSRLLREIMQKEREGPIFTRNLSQQYEIVWLQQRKSIHQFDIIFSKKIWVTHTLSLLALQQWESKFFTKSGP